MIAQLINGLAIAVGCLIGLLFKNIYNEKVANTINHGLTLCVLYIGLCGLMKEIDSVLIVIISMVFGSIIGELIDIDKKLDDFSKFVEKKMNKGGIAEAFLTSTLLFCVGAMAIVGALNASIMHDYSVTYAKTTIDFVTSIIYGSTLGIGVMFSGLSVFIYQGTLTLLGSLLIPLLSDVVINYMNVVGSIILIGLALNMFNLTKIKLANLIPSIFMPIFICLIF